MIFPVLVHNLLVMLHKTTILSMGSKGDWPRECMWMEGSRNTAEPSNQVTELSNNNSTPAQALDGMIR